MARLLLIALAACAVMKDCTVTAQNECTVVNCVACSAMDNTTCVDCAPNFVIEGSGCKPNIGTGCIDQNCVLCPETPAVCLQCNPGYDVVNNETCVMPGGNTEAPGNNAASPGNIWIPLIYMLAFILFIA